MSLISEAFRAACKELDYSPWPNGARFIRAGGRLGGTILENTDIEALEKSGAELLFTDPATVGALLHYVIETLPDTDEVSIVVQPKVGRRPSVRINRGGYSFYHGDTIAEALVGVLQGEAARVKRDNDTKKKKESR